ncbi:MAG: GNAT family N-acetyltransferase [Leptolyngbyaceae cyanobacterium bins.59]|nr:GNAT family N-acetyltransferase [Leptolyngbyaceae cyanobacterium bins.59]
MITLEPLSPDTIGEAIRLTDRVFDYPAFWWEKPSFVLWLSLNNGFIAKTIYRFLGVEWATYWVARDEEGAVVGITGLYTYLKEPEAYWLGWTCVDPQVRGRKIGSGLVDFAIAQTREAGKAYLRLYTWDDEAATVARQLYERRGFHLTRTEDLKTYRVLYYDLALSNSHP